MHQAAKAFINNGVEVCMYYDTPHVLKVPDKYKKYNIRVSDTIIDNPNNIIVVPESMTYVLAKYRHIRKVIWWLSVDFYESGKPWNWAMDALAFKKLPRIAYPAVVLYRLAKTYFYYYHFEDHNKYIHFYNCEYAHQYLLSHGVLESHTRYLCGPLTDCYIHNTIKDKSIREDIILYNPKKGFDFTKRIISEAGRRNLKAKFVPLEHMNEEDIRNIMGRSKVYVDFGEFPGPERIPREAVMMGCNIVTSNQGAAAYHEDVPIPDDLKYPKNIDFIPKIVDRIHDMLLHYEDYFHYYDEYRAKVKDQPNLFNDEIKNLSSIILDNSSNKINDGNTTY